MFEHYFGATYRRKHSAFYDSFQHGSVPNIEALSHAILVGNTESACLMLFSSEHTRLVLPDVRVYVQQTDVTSSSNAAFLNVLESSQVLRVSTAWDGSVSRF
jgi:hypothetical protein